MLLLSILIPTVTERRRQRNQLVDFLHRTIDLEGLEEEVEVIFLEDNKEMTIGEKREQLYRMADGLYSWQLDDDDCPSSDALALIIAAARNGPDCITFEERVIIDGVEQRSNFSLKYKEWGNDEDGFAYVRTPFFKTPIKTRFCVDTAIPHIRFGEDHAFAIAIKPLLQSEIHIDKQLYYYIHNSTPHNKRYGITED